jgi:hypothetical protein
MPHWDQDAQLTGCKVRARSGDRWSFGDSVFDHLYGAWLGRPTRDVLLTEGETDGAWASFVAERDGIQVDVRALPAGARRPPSAVQLDHLRRARTIYLAFDPDTVGVEATRTWIQALVQAGLRRIRVCCLPLERDLRSARPDLAHLLQRAKRPLEEPPDMLAQDGGFVRLNQKGEPRAVCTWTLEPVAQLTGGDLPCPASTSSSAPGASRTAASSTWRTSPA